MMRQQHIVHLLTRHADAGADRFLIYPSRGWVSPADGREHLTLPAKRTVKAPLEPYIQGTPLDVFVNAILHDELGLPDDSYVLEQELPAVVVEMDSPIHHEPTEYVVYPLDVWVAAEQSPGLTARMDGHWLTLHEALDDPRLSPTSRAVLALLRDRPAALSRPADRPTMDGLALKWVGENRSGVRHLAKDTLERILAAGNRAFNLRVADPYLRYQFQGVGFTWSFFTDKDRQDIHVHGAPVVEIYGVLAGEL